MGVYQPLEGFDDQIPIRIRSLRVLEGTPLNYERFRLYPKP